MLASTRSARLPSPIPPAPAAAAIPEQLWLLRDRRTGLWVSSYQESATICRQILVSASSADAVAQAVAFYSRFCLREVDPVRVL